MTSRFCILCIKIYLCFFSHLLGILTIILLLSVCISLWPPGNYALINYMINDSLFMLISSEEVYFINVYVYITKY